MEPEKPLNKTPKQEGNEEVKQVKVLLERCNTDVQQVQEEDKPSCIENIAEEVKDFVEQFLQEDKKVETGSDLKPMQFIW